MTIRERVIIFDVEAFRHVSGRALWCCGFRWIDSKGNVNVRIVDSEQPDALDKLRAMVAWCLKFNRLLVGFNVRSYDLTFIARMIASGESIDAKELSDSLIHELDDVPKGDLRDKLSREISRERVAEWSRVIPESNVLDLASRYRVNENEALRKGLKTTAAMMGFDDIRELPYPAHLRLDDDQWKAVLEYNGHDLLTTEFVFRHHESTFEALAVLSESCGVNLINKSDADAAEIYFIETFKRRTGSTPGYFENLPESVRLRINDQIPTLETPEAADWQQFVTDTSFPFDVEAKSLDVRSEPYKKASRKIIVGDLELSVGFGGIHSVHTKEQSEFYKSDDNFEVVNCDVQSYYPNLILKTGIPIGTTGSVGLDIYRHVLEQRLELKRRSKDKRLPEPERRQAKTADTAFKVVANSLYGKLSYRWSRLNTPGSLPSVTMTGQLGLVHLIEQLQSVGCRIVQANTDGVVVVARRDDQRWREVCSSWESRLGLTLEFEPFAALALHDSNNWLAMRPDGSLYGKGSLRTESGGIHQQHLPSIINTAVMNTLVHRIPPEQTVQNCDDIRKFLFVESTSKRNWWLETPNGSVSVSKCLRGFAAYPSINQRLRSDKELPDKIPEHLGTAWQIPGSIPKSLNREWYVGQARRTLGSFGLQFNAQELSGDAVSLWKLGLVPQPAFAKVSGSGTTSTNAISCVDWSRYPTLKVFTGPRPGNVDGVPGIVAFDIDKPEKWQAFFGLDVAAIAELKPLTVHKSDRPEQVWNGTGRGKLLFRFTNANHRFGDRFLAKSRLKWLSQFGFELFYGNGTVSALGEAGNGQSYRISGELCDLPKWFESKIISAIGRGSSSKKKTGIGGLLEAFHHMDDASVSDQDEPDWTSILQTLTDECDSRFGTVSSYVSQRRNVRLSDGNRDNRFALRMRCPGGRDSHDSGNSTDREAELFLDNLTGRPVFKCKHTSCSFQAVFDEWTRERPKLDVVGMEASGTTVVLPNLPDVRPTPISDLILNRERISLIEATTGSGKTYGACIAAGIEARRGRHVFYVTTATNLVRQFYDLFVKLNPDLVDRIAMKRDELNTKIDTDDVASIDEDLEIEGEQSENDPGDDSEDKILVRVICHEALGRRDFSRFARHMWTMIHDRPDSLVIVDEFDAFVSPGLETTYPFAVRAYPTGSDKHRSWNLTVLRDCPASVAEASRPFSSCERCECYETTGRFIHSTFRTPTLERPAFAWRRSLDEPVHILNGHEIKLNLDDFQCERPERVHENATVKPVVSYLGQRLDGEHRRGLARSAYNGDFDDTNHETPETVPLVLEHVIGHMLFPVVKEHFPIDQADGSRMTREEVMAIEQQLRPKQVQYPIRACDAPYLVGIDALPLELLREFAAFGGNVVFMTATLSSLTEAVLTEVFGEDVKRHKVQSHNQRIESFAVVTVGNQFEPVRLNQIQPDSLKRLSSNDWHDELGKWLILGSSIRSAKLVSSVIDKSGVNFAIAKGSGQSFGGERHTTSHDTICGTVGSVRQPVGRGYDGTELSLVVLDVNSMRLSVDMVCRHAQENEKTDLLYQQFTDEELMTTIGQCMGRGLRGDDLKRFCVVLLNCPPGLAKHIVETFRMDQRADRTEYVHYPCVSDAIFRDGERWLAKVDDVWSQTMTINEQSVTKHQRRVLERTVARLNSRESKRMKILDNARDAMNDGVVFREFVRINNIHRLSKATIPGLLDQIREIFGNKDIQS